MQLRVQISAERRYFCGTERNKRTFRWFWTKDCSSTRLIREWPGEMVWCSERASTSPIRSVKVHSIRRWIRSFNSNFFKCLEAHQPLDFLGWRSHELHLPMRSGPRQNIHRVQLDHSTHYRCHHKKRLRFDQRRRKIECFRLGRRVSRQCQSAVGSSRNPARFKQPSRSDVQWVSF